MSARDRFNAALFGGTTAQQQSAEQISALPIESVNRLNSFSLSMFSSIAGAEKNVFVSPLSVATALGMATRGATQGSTTEAELIALLGEENAPVPASADSKVKVQVANSAWITSAVKPTFVQDIQKAFRAEVSKLPTSVSPINSWVSKRTNGMIRSIIDELPSNVVALLVNAVYFKASWTTAFDAKKTVDSPFYAPAGRDHSKASGTVRMMKIRNEKFDYATVKLAEGQEVQVVDLPYGNDGTYVATVVVPEGSVTMDDVVSKLNANLWHEWMDSLSNTKLSLVSMPRFKLEYSASSLKSTLQSMGVKGAFKGDPENGAFLRMTDVKDTYIDDIVHKAVVEVTEEGTEASAATAVMLMSRSLPRRTPMVVMDRPFLFSIRNRISGAVLFIGRVDNPVSP